MVSILKRWQCKALHDCKNNTTGHTFQSLNDIQINFSRQMDSELRWRKIYAEDGAKLAAPVGDIDHELERP